MSSSFLAIMVEEYSAFSQINWNKMSFFFLKKKNKKVHLRNSAAKWHWPDTQNDPQNLCFCTLRQFVAHFLTSFCLVILKENSSDMQMLTTRAVGRDPWEETPDRCFRIPRRGWKVLLGSYWTPGISHVFPKSGRIDASPQLSHLMLWTFHYWCSNTVDNAVKFVSTKACQCHGDPGIRRQPEKAVSTSQTHGLCCLVSGYSGFLSLTHLKRFILLGDLVGAAS